MTLHPEQIGAFLSIFDEASPRIRTFDGCRHLELWQDPRYPNLLSTYSIWNSETALQAYRSSPLFQATWARTRPLFAAPAQAFSHLALRSDSIPAHDPNRPG